MEVRFEEPPQLVVIFGDWPLGAGHDIRHITLRAATHRAMRKSSLLEGMA
jgi:hypothetical protein